MLKIPYPFYYRGKNIAILGIVLFFMSMIFNYFFEPFHVNPEEHRMDFFWICFMHSLTAVVVIILSLIMCNRFIDFTHWNTGKELLLITMILTLVGIGQFLIRDIIYNNQDNWSFRYLYEEVRNTLLIGFLFVFILIPLNLLRLSAQQSKGLPAMLKYINAMDSAHFIPTLSIRHPDGNELFCLDTGQFIMAKAEGNYLEIFNTHSESVSKSIYRITLKEFEKQITLFPFIVKTHRSYIINLKMIEHISGNAQGLALRLKNLKGLAPVSRNRIKSFEQALAMLSN
ncbi:MAG TPA: LytTR family transcriptional regulator DNA-binding domain-containing protein [Saprospiraceae bacterium]|nr:LytTR family transcriptional regulator DNA-binding domain-containing protein [Saprospiraceae bacterium]